MIMAHNNHQEFVCGGCDRDFTVSTSTPDAKVSSLLILSTYGFYAFISVTERRGRS